nr:hypothetical protein Iba_chr12fCG9250 [Ipomoea batatas]
MLSKKSSMITSNCIFSKTGDLKDNSAGYGLTEYACDFSSAGYGLLSKMSGQNVASKFRRMFVLGFCFVDFFLGFGFVLNLGTSDSTLEGWESF